MKSPVLFIDDEIEMIEAYRSVLQEHFTLFTASNVEQGLKILTQKEIHIVVCDMRMPGLNGADFLEIANQSFRKPIKIILSGFVDEFFNDRFQTRYRPYAIIRKPISDAERILKILLEAQKEYEFRYGTEIKKENNFLNTHEVLRRLGISKPTLYKYLRAGMPSQRLGGRRFFKWEEISIWVKSPGSCL